MSKSSAAKCNLDDDDNSDKDHTDVDDIFVDNLTNDHSIDD